LVMAGCELIWCKRHGDTWHGALQWQSC
jgi:hypothetical protein